MDKFIKIAITRPDFYTGEAFIINKLLKEGSADYVHIRKPSADIKDVENLIALIDKRHHPKLKLHDCFNLIDKFDLGGCHLNSRNVIPHPGAKSISKSIHSIKEIPLTEEYDYFFISPVFDSISKNNYKSAFDIDILSRNVKGRKAIALGGVTPDKITLLKEKGFYGAAMLSHFFPNETN